MDKSTAIIWVAVLTDVALEFLYRVAKPIVKELYAFALNWYKFRLIKRLLKRR
jgi:hypothetical protein